MEDLDLLRLSSSCTTTHKSQLNEEVRLVVVVTVKVLEWNKNEAIEDESGPCRRGRRKRRVPRRVGKRN